MKAKSEIHLSRRERQIMDVVYQRGRASAVEVMENMPSPPSYSAVRALLRILEDKGYLRHEKSGPRYEYLPIVSPKVARKSAMSRVLNTFFAGSTEQAMVALLEMSEARLSQQELDRLAEMIEEAKREGR